MQLRDEACCCDALACAKVGGVAGFQQLRTLVESNGLDEGLEPGDEGLLEPLFRRSFVDVRHGPSVLCERLVGIGIFPTRASGGLPMPSVLRARRLMA